MLNDDDEPRDGRRARARFTPIPLDRLGVDELEAYIAELRAEIARTETEIGRKRNHRSAADSVFKLS